MLLGHHLPVHLEELTRAAIASVFQSPLACTPQSYSVLGMAVISED